MAPGTRLGRKRMRLLCPPGRVVQWLAVVFAVVLAGEPGISTETPVVNATAGRRLAAKFTGTGLLVVVGSGIADTRLTGDGALLLLVYSLGAATGRR
jgi:hypothetical protein